MKYFGAALIAAAVISSVTLGGYQIKKVFEAGRNAEKAANGLQQRVRVLEAGNRVLARDLLYMTAKNEAAIEMAENLLGYTRLAYPMRSEDIIEELASYQRGLLALLDKLREIKQ